MTDRNRRVAPARGRAGKGRAPARERPARAVFVSYRRSDAAGEAGRLADHLASALGEPSVFLDVAAIAAGDDWRSRLDTALDACDTMLVVIGRQWLTLPSSEHPSRRRIDDSTDMVAWEVARALTRGLRVVQVLVQGVSPLVPETLPSAIAALAMRQAVELRHESFAADVQALVAQVRKSRRVRSLFAGDWRAADLSRWERPLDCGPDATCAAFTIVNALELLLVRAGAPQALSARYLYEKAKRSEQRRVDVEGIYMLPALFVASFFGVPPESVWPYQTGKADLPQGITWQTLEESLELPWRVLPGRRPCRRGAPHRCRPSGDSGLSCLRGRRVQARSRRRDQHAVDNGGVEWNHECAAHWLRSFRAPVPLALSLGNRLW
jgi:hypothetical protein